MKIFRMPVNCLGRAVIPYLSQQDVKSRSDGMDSVLCYIYTYRLWEHWADCCAAIWWNMWNCAVTETEVSSSSAGPFILLWWYSPMERTTRGLTFNWHTTGMQWHAQECHLTTQLGQMRSKWNVDRWSGWVLGWVSDVRCFFGLTAWGRHHGRRII